MVGGLQGEEWKFIQKYLKEKISCGVSKNRGDFAPRMGWCENFAQGNVLCEFRTSSHKLKVLCEFRTSLEQLSSEGHIFLISAPNRTRFEALDS